MSEDTTSGANDTTPSGSNDTVPAGNAADTIPSGSNDTPPSFDWRKELSSGDDQFLKKLERYSTPEDFRKAVNEKDKRISEGFKAPELPENATEEQVKEYRSKIGVPDKVEDYKFPEGVVVGEQDKPLWDVFLTEANKANLTQAEFNKIAPAYYAFEKGLREQAEKATKDAIEANTAALKEQWKADFDANQGINKSFLEKTGGTELVEQLLLGTTADGSPIANNPAIAQWINKMARMDGFRDPMPGGNVTIDNMEAELDKYRTMMRNDRPAWNKDLKAQERYRELVTYKDKIGKS